MDSNLHRLIYRSSRIVTGDTDESAFELDRILDRAREKNGQKNVTGVLLSNERSFIQVLEGPLPAVSEIFERICRDMRHTDINLIEFEAIQQRAFGGWSMAETGLPDGGTIDLDFSGGWDAVQSILAGLRRDVVRRSDEAIPDPCHTTDRPAAAG